jgi:hypothetical protein
MFDEKGRFVIENYNKQSTFSSFLPGISGLKGIPIWCFYVNRGQAIASFGTEDKNHSIMEFYPAHQAYQFTKTMGFRTFIKVDGEFYEPFYENNRNATMYIGMNELEIEELNEDLGIQVNVLYYTLPNEKLGGLVRRISIQNKYKTKRSIELLDGMPAIIPYGIELSALKEMAQTMKAWMQVEDVDLKLPYYRVRYSTKDSAKVSKIEEGNYCISMTEEGERLSIIADPQIIFEHDTSYQQPEGFKNSSLKDLIVKKQILQNQVPSSFSTCIKELGEREDFTVNTVIGQATNKQIYHHFADRCQIIGYFKDKYKEANNLTKELSKGIESKTSNKIFDEYCRQTYVDNVLRGGYPIKLVNNHIFYVYSRKHGDIERDYNFFRMLPEYYSQGNGNFRDVNQNRRSDVLYSPYVRDYNIKTFYNLIQLDGYNPLVVKQITYQLQDFNNVLSFIDSKNQLVMEEFFKMEFSPGQLLEFLEKEKIELTLTKEAFLEEVICHSEQNLNADFTEGYWVDHWTYNLDLIETYLKVYPEEEENLLFEDNTYSYYESKAIVLPRSKRYLETENGVRQYHCVDEETKGQVECKQVRSKKGTGSIYYSNLFTKLLVIIQNRFASLDMFGMGIEMEGGKPGWYDALNGLPGMFGSSMAETYELQRLLLYVRDILEAYPRDIEVFSELYEFMMGTMDTLKEIKLHEVDKMQVWNQLNCLKEEYREKTIWGVEGTNQIITKSGLGYLINLYISYVEDGIRNAMKMGNGLCPTYFYYNLEKYKKIDGQIVPLTFQQVTMPLFLEGIVRYLKLPNAKEEKLKLYDRIQKSGLYDEKLKMYKVNESLSTASFEVGRAKAFSPGWLENESIWLHMEYKYLLQLLKNGLYEEFFRDLRDTCIPFLDYSIYGRSLLENSSFLASSVNLDEGIHGKGFVARLSGSTAEFLEMWQVMMFGEKPFQIWNGNLICSFKPSIPSYLICENNSLEATFLGSIKVIYHVNKKNDLIPENYRIDTITVEYLDGRKQCFQEIIDGSTPIDIRNGEVSNILCEIKLL